MHTAMYLLHRGVFHIDTKKGSPEIHPPRFMLLKLKSRHLTSAQWSQMTGLAIPWRDARSFHGLLISLYILYRGCHKPFYTDRKEDRKVWYGEYSREIVEHIKPVMLQSTILAIPHAQLLCTIEELQCPIYLGVEIVTCFSIASQSIVLLYSL